MIDTDAAYDQLICMTRPALLLAPTSFLDHSRVRLDAAGVTDAVAEHHTGAIFHFIVGLTGLQGISDAAAFACSERHDNATHAEIGAPLALRPSRPLHEPRGQRRCSAIPDCDRFGFRPKA